MKIRSDILRTYQSIHTWTGILTGLVLFIAFYAGALTMFKPQLEQWATPPPQTFEQTHVEFSQIDTLIQQAAQQHPKVKEGFTVHLDKPSTPLSWYEKGGGREITLDDKIQYAAFDQNGQVIAQATNTNELGTLIDQLHRTGGIPGKVGHEDIGVLILGIASGLYFIALISGVIILLPTLVKNFFALRQHKGANRFWLDSHNLVGITSLPFHLVIAWTVVVFAFHDPFYAGLGVIYGDKPLFNPPTANKVVHEISQLPRIEQYIDKVETMADGYQIRSLSFSQLSTTRPSVAVEVAADDRLQRGGYSDIIYLNPYSLEVSYSTVSLPEDDAYGPIVNSFFSLHFGNYAGHYGRWIYFAMGLMGAFLFYSGNLLWLEKRREKHGEQRRSTRIMSALTAGICLGSMLGVAASMLATKWLYLITQEINHAYLVCYYSLFLAAIVYSFKRGAAVAAIHLLNLLAAVCVLIPATTIVSRFIPAMSHWAMAQPSTVMIETMAFVFAVIFYKIANKAKLRSKQAPHDSVWSQSSSPKSIDNNSKANNEMMSKTITSPRARS